MKCNNENCTFFKNGQCISDDKYVQTHARPDIHCFAFLDKKYSSYLEQEYAKCGKT